MAEYWKTSTFTAAEMSSLNYSQIQLKRNLNKEITDSQLTNYLSSASGMATVAGFFLAGTAATVVALVGTWCGIVAGLSSSEKAAVNGCFSRGNESLTIAEAEIRSMTEFTLFEYCFPVVELLKNGKKFVIVQGNGYLVRARHKNGGWISFN